MKKIGVILLLAVSLPVFFLLKPAKSDALSHQAVFVIGRKNYTADGQSKLMDVAPFVSGDRAYVPVRFLGNAMGIGDDSIAWDEESGSVTLSLQGTVVRLAVGNPVIRVNGKETVMDAVPLLKDGRVFLPVRWVARSFGYEVGWDEASGAVLLGPPGDLPGPPADESFSLPPVGSYENLKSLLESVTVPNYGRFLLEDAAGLEAAVSQSSKAAAGRNAAAPTDYSGTNVQVEGVDEADVVKTDGNYIYQVSGERLVITLARPAEEMKVAAVLDYAGKDFTPREIYVDGSFLTVIGQTRRYGYMPKDEAGAWEDRAAGIVPPYRMHGTTRVIVYDIGDKSNPKQARELEIYGNYASSRKIGSAVYLVANRGIYYYPMKEIEDPKPVYRDSAAGNGLLEIDYPEIKYFPGCVMPNYLIVAGFSLDRPDEKANVYAYLGSGENVYASPENLYVAVTGFSPAAWRDGSGTILPGPLPDLQKTRIYKFAMSDGKLAYRADGEVPGAVLNQFSMDEYNGYFRIATTRGDVWQTGENTSKNNVYVLDGKLEEVGKIEDIAPGERIYSVRFTGDRGYMVTFKTVDPFFVIDLKDPARPGILGALKIPGYSDYLHPYDENHVIGFGKDTVEIGQKSPDGSSGGSMAFYQGMKMAIFDVSDVKNPVEMFRESIGDRGTDSELLRNHKALLFSAEKGLLAFPVRLMEIRDGGRALETGFPRYGEFVFQGAYVYDVNLVDGFKLKGRITHLSDQDYLKTGNYWYDSDKNVERIIYINDTLYTLSRKFIKANSLNDLKEIRTVEIS